MRLSREWRRTGYLYLNGGYVATLDLAARAARGNIAAATALFSGNAVSGRSLHYERFTVLSLDDVGDNRQAYNRQAAGVHDPRMP